MLGRKCVGCYVAFKIILTQSLHITRCRRCRGKCYRHLQYVHGIRLQSLCKQAHGSKLLGFLGKHWFLQRPTFATPRFSSAGFGDPGHLGWTCINVGPCSKMKQGVDPARVLQAAGVGWSWRCGSVRALAFRMPNPKRMPELTDGAVVRPDEGAHPKANLAVSHPPHRSWQFRQDTKAQTAHEGKIHILMMLMRGPR